MERIRRLAYGWQLWKGYMRIGFLKMTQYPADTSIWLVSMLIREASGFIGILAIAGVTGGIGSWNVYEICILFSMCAVIEAIGQTFFDSVWELINMIRWGRLDVYLTRPAPVLLQVLGEYMCQGKMPDAVRRRYEQMEDSPRKQVMLKNFDQALAHPSREDLEGLKQAVLLLN